MRLYLSAAVAILATAGLAVPIAAQTAPPTIFPLNVKPVPAQTDDIILDRTAAAQLGKALFWDIKVGSDGNACATCHFAAGADIRPTHQVNPGGEFNALRQFVQDRFNPRKSNGAPFGVNVMAVAADFPFHVLSNPLDRDSTVLYSTNDVFSSSGTFAGAFTSTSVELNAYGQSVWSGLLGSLTESCRVTFDTANPFHQTVGGKNLIHRRVEPRNSPTVINAVFNIRQFWDGRANNVFNGVDPFGERSNAADPSAGVVVPGTTPNALVLKKLALKDSSLASQAVGPPLSSAEMSCDKRTFADIGRKLIGLKPLSVQTVHSQDSLFSVTTAPYAPLVTAPRQTGLNTTYAALIQRAFNGKYWNAAGKYKIVNGAVQADAAGYSQMELNFSLFWGLALQEYQSLLISDKTPFDLGTMTAAARRGQDVFTGQGKCIACHNGPLFSNATTYVGRSPEFVERMLVGNGGVALYDEGFYNIGVRPTVNDLGVGGTDPFGNPLSFSRQFVGKLQGGTPVDQIVNQVDPCRFDVPFSSDLLPGQPCSALPNATQAAGLRVAVDGAMKTPLLRNIALTPPYMHNGGFATLAQVVEFYNRGGNRRSTGACSGKGGPNGDTTGFGDTCSNLDADIQPLGLSWSQSQDLVEFLKALTDDRVACMKGPFDHPSLTVSTGHYYISALQSGQRAPDLTATLPATGTFGLGAEGKPCLPNIGDLFGSTQSTINAIVR